MSSCKCFSVHRRGNSRSRQRLPTNRYNKKFRPRKKADEESAESDENKGETVDISATSEVVTPRPITSTFGCAKEKLRRTMWVRGFTTPGRDVPLGGACVVERSRGRGGLNTSILFGCCV